MPIDPERLLAEMGFVRRLARALVTDPGASQDLEQETLAAALRRPPERAGDRRDLRRWLRAVLERQRAMAWRSDRRREARERAADCVPYVLQDPAAIAAQSEVVQFLTKAVHDLGDSQREVIVHHFYRGRPLAEIARELGVPDSTVRNRLHRALQCLREQFAREVRASGRRHWSSSLGMLAALDQSAPAPAAAESAAKSAANAVPVTNAVPAATIASVTKVAIPVAVAMAAILVASWVWRDRGADPAGTARSPALTTAGSPARRPEPRAENASGESTPVQRESIAPTTSAVGSATTVASTGSEIGATPRALLRGRIQGLEAGHPWTTQVRVVRERVPATVSEPASRLAIPADVDGAGGFTADLDALLDDAADPIADTTVTVEADDPIYVPVRAAVELADGTGAIPPPPWQREVVLQVTLAAVACGRLVDEHGTPISAAELEIHSLRAAGPPSGSAWAAIGEDGAFEVRIAAEGEAALFVFPEVQGFLPSLRRVSLQRGRVAQMGTWTLASGETLAGIVQDSSDVALAGAELSVAPRNDPTETVVPGLPTVVQARVRSHFLRPSSASSDRYGRFSVSGLFPGEYSVSCIALEGHPLHADLERRSRVECSIPGAPVNLVLGGKLGTIEVLQDGAPAPAVRVTIGESGATLGSTDAAGEVRCWLGAGDHVVTAVADRARATAHFEVSADSTAPRTTLVLPSTAPAQDLRIVLAGEAAAATRAYAELLDTSGSVFRRIALERSKEGEEGFVLPSAPPGRFELRIRPGAGPSGFGGGFLEWSGTLVVPRDDADGPIVVESRQGAVLELRLEELPAASLANPDPRARLVRCRLRRERGEWRAPMLVAREALGWTAQQGVLVPGVGGTVEPPLEPGVWEIEVSAPGLRPLLETRELHAGERTVLAVEMEPWQP